MEVVYSCILECPAEADTLFDEGLFGLEGNVSLVAALQPEETGTGVSGEAEANVETEGNLEGEFRFAGSAEGCLVSSDEGLDDVFPDTVVGSDKDVEVFCNLWKLLDRSPDESSGDVGTLKSA